MMDFITTYPGLIFGGVASVFWVILSVIFRGNFKQIKSVVELLTIIVDGKAQLEDSNTEADPDQVVISEEVSHTTNYKKNS